MKNPGSSKNFPGSPHLTWMTMVQPQATLYSLLVRPRTQAASSTSKTNLLKQFFWKSFRVVTWHAGLSSRQHTVWAARDCIESLWCCQADTQLSFRLWYWWFTSGDYPSNLKEFGICCHYFWDSATWNKLAVFGNEDLKYVGKMPWKLSSTGLDVLPDIY